MHLVVRQKNLEKAILCLMFRHIFPLVLSWNCWMTYLKKNTIDYAEACLSSIGMKHPSCKRNPNLGDIVPGERQAFAEG